MSEQSIIELAPAGSLWVHDASPEPREILECKGLHEDWRNPRDWTEGVPIVPVVWIGDGTVTESELREQYTRVYHDEGSPHLRLEEQLDGAAPWWKAPLRDGFISIETRPSYCDRGHYICKLFPTGALAVSIDAHDGWPRYYFDWDRMLAELEAWAEKRNQVPW